MIFLRKTELSIIMKSDINEMIPLTREKKNVAHICKPIHNFMLRQFLYFSLIHALKIYREIRTSKIQV